MVFVCAHILFLHQRQRWRQTASIRCWEKSLNYVFKCHIWNGQIKEKICSVWCNQCCWLQKHFSKELLSSKRRRSRRVRKNVQWHRICHEINWMNSILFSLSPVCFFNSISFSKNHEFLLNVSYSQSALQPIFPWHQNRRKNNWLQNISYSENVLTSFFFSLFQYNNPSLTLKEAGEAWRSSKPNADYYMHIWTKKKVVLITKHVDEER